jgi:hypothetical protein
MSPENPASPPSNSATAAPPQPGNPWPGLASYTEQDKERFFGREREIAEVLRMIEREALTVIFGRSGLGKTSLLRAGVIPQLQESAYFPIALRLDYSDRRLSPVQQLITLARDAAHAASVELENDPAETPDLTLWEFFHSVEFWSPRNDQLKPILFIDQFEEVFTIGRNVGVAAEFLEQLADLIENRIPRAVQERVVQSGKPLHIDAAGRNYKVVLSLREDFVSKLDSLRSSMPAIMRNRFSLEPLSGERALTVIVKAGGAWVAPDVARDIVAAVAGRTESGDSSAEYTDYAEIEPAYLSEMCHELFDRMLALGRSAITRDLVKQEHGGILEELYERSFDGLSGKARVFVEDRLLTTSGFRAAVPLADALREGMDAKELETLVDRRLLRFEDRLGTTHVELSHDLLTSVVLRSRDERRAHEALEKEAVRQAELRRAFRSRVTAALVGAVIAAMFLGTLLFWALEERKLANQERASAVSALLIADSARKRADDSIRMSEVQQNALKDQAKELELQKEMAETEKKQADASNQAMKAEKNRIQELSDNTLQSLQDVTVGTYQDALKVIDLYDNNLDENVKQQLNASLKAEMKTLRESLKTAEKILAAEPDDSSAKSIKMSLLFAIADLDSRAYGFDETEYKDFLSYSRTNLDDKDVWLQAKALRRVAQAGGIMYRKGDQNAAKALLEEVRLKGGKLQSRSDRGSFTAATWDSLEDAYEDCAKLQREHDPEDAKSWFVLAIQTEKLAAQMDDGHLRDVALICDSFGDFEVAQRDYPTAIREYTDAIQSSKEMLRIHNAGKPDLALVTYLVDRGDAEFKSSAVDAARSDFQESQTLTDKLDDTPENRYQKMVVLERLGGLEMAAKSLRQALDWYTREKQIALELADKDVHRRQSLPVVYEKVRDALHALGDTQGERLELEDEAAHFEKWTRPNDDASIQAYIKVVEALGDFTFKQADYKSAQASYEAAVTQAQQLAVRWPSASNRILHWDALYKASSAAEELNEKDVALSDLRDSLKVAQDLPANNEKRDLLLAYSQFHMARIYEGQAQPGDALKMYREAKPAVSKLAVNDCAEHLDDFHQAEFGIIKALVELKRQDEAQAEGREAKQFVETNCAAVEKDGNKEGKATLAQFWGGLGYSFTMAGADALALTCDEKGLSIDGSQAWIKVNVAHAYLFTGRVDEAKRLYNEIKTLQWNDRLLRQDIRADFKELRSLGRDHPAMDGILSMIEEPGK